MKISKSTGLLLCALVVGEGVVQGQSDSTAQFSPLPRIYAAAKSISALCIKPQADEYHCVTAEATEGVPSKPQCADVDVAFAMRNINLSDPAVPTGFLVKKIGDDYSAYTSTQVKLITLCVQITHLLK